MPVASPSAETLVLVLKKRKEPHFSFSVSFPCLLVEKSILSLPDQFENSVSWNLKIGGEPHNKELGERRVTWKSSVCCMLGACLEGLASEKLPKHRCMRGEGAEETMKKSPYVPGVTCLSFLQKIQFSADFGFVFCHQYFQYKAL